MSIYRVADQAGVSIATVSRVINHKSNVLPETREKVLEAIKTLGYREESLGQGGRGKTGETILMVFPTMANLLYADMMRGACEYCDNLGVNLVTGNAYQDADREQRLCQMARDKQFSGVILVSPQLSAQEINALAAALPVVQCSDYREESNTPVVCVNDTRTAYDAVSYLIGLGLNKIGMISALDVQTSSLAREKGYVKALREAGISADPTLIVRSSYDFEQSQEAVRDMLARHPDVEGLFCVSDVIAYNAVRIAQETGRRVPADLSVVGHDNVFIAGMSQPAITTINQESYKIGYYAAKTLFDQKNIEPHLRNNTITYIEHSLVVRGSTRAPSND